MNAASYEDDIPVFPPDRVRHAAHFATLHGPVGGWFRQTPGNDGIFGVTRFAADSAGGRGEWLVVCDEPPAGFATRIPRRRRILFLGEPAAYKRYQPAYLRQFGIVVGPTHFAGFAGVQVVQHAALPWHYGQVRGLGWRDILRPKAKQAALSVFCSDKTFTPVQRQRIRFVEALKRRFGSLVHHYGNGFNRLEEKADGLDPYRYTIVLENNTEPGFWTEKLADAYLGLAFPFYAGGAVSPDDLDPRARIDIALDDVEGACRAIEAALAADTAMHALPLLRAQRHAIMTRHNFFAVADRVIGAQRVRPGLRWWREPVRQSWTLP